MGIINTFKTWLRKRCAMLAAVSLLCVTTAANAEVKPHGLFSDNAVLQQGMNFPVWGTAADGEQVTVEINDQNVSTTAAKGRWSVSLKPMSAGGPFTMKVTGPANAVTINNVMVGEVWLVTGQSNMGLGLGKRKDAKAIEDKSVDPKLRYFLVGMRGSEQPLTEVQGRWMEASAYSTHMVSMVGYFFGRDLRAARDVPVGLIQATVGGTNADTWIPRSYLDADPIFKFAFDRWTNQLKACEAAAARYKQDEPALKKKWEEDAAKAKADGKPAPAAPQPLQDPLSDPRCRPSNQYNGLIASLHPYSIRGAAWYQGENDAGEAVYYRTVLPTMIRSWRDAWGQGDFPFLIVQLPPCGPINTEPPARAEWAEMRESQAAIAQKVSHACVVSTIDLGDEANPSNLHPPKKQPIGERLAVAARAVVYGEKIEFTGPVFDQAKFDGANVSISFTHVGSGLVTRDSSELKGFAIAGEDKKFVFAKAEIQGDKVVVSSPQVGKPVAVRYAWDNYPVCNLASKDGLPALPFRTDDFPVRPDSK